MTDAGSTLISRYAAAPGAFDEMLDADGSVRPHYRAAVEQLSAVSDRELLSRAEYVGSTYLEQGITFDVGGKETPFPLDVVPRIITAKDFAQIEAGIAQRVRALEAFLQDIYSTGSVFVDGVMPRRVVTSSTHYHRAAHGIQPPNGVRIHVAGTDLVRGADGQMRVLEDNVRVPSGVSYVLTNRRAMSSAFPEAMSRYRIRAVHEYPSMLLNALRAAAPSGVTDPTVVVLTPGVYNSAYFEHALLARTMGVELVEAGDLVCQNGRVMARTTRGLRRVDVIYRRVDDDFIDPAVFRPDSMLGVAGLMAAARAGNVTIANAVGNGVADDKLTCTYVDDLIRYFLGEEPILPGVTTWRLEEPAALEEVLDRLDELVVKPVDGSGGKGVVIGPKASAQELEALRKAVLARPRDYIAQPVVQLSTVPTVVDGKVAPRHVDLRPFAVNDGERVRVVPGGLTRVALQEGQLIVNSSQGGGSKDTWVLDDARVRLPEPKPARGKGPRHPSLVLDDEGERPVVQVQTQSQSQGGQSQTQRAKGVRSVRRQSPMTLSRIADSLFWTSRYLERAEDTSRILDANVQFMVEDPTVDHEQAARALLGAMGEDADATSRGRPVDITLVLDRLCYAVDAPSSLRATLFAARESARHVREVISLDMWEAINTAYLDVRSPSFTRQPVRQAFRQVRHGAILASGMARTTMVKEEGFEFMMLGRSLERVDMTSRLILAAATSGGTSVAWSNALRAAGGHQSFVRTNMGEGSVDAAAAFLLFNDRFPRSLVYGLAAVEHALRELEPRSSFARQDEALVTIGRVRAEIEYLPADKVLDGLADRMEHVQQVCTEVGTLVSQRYLTSGVPEAWKEAPTCG
ncbi:MAG TPA: circularly permuted type 2 ATP-grasp protein [Candidatus Luteococcus avicola]|nr:circularly permuted type 2 ATP-grasp protein [Candidatus Luteococcus avicola]